MSNLREVGTVGEWTYHDHRMARFEDRRVFCWVAAANDEGTRWSWVVMLPGREPGSRTSGEASTAFEAAKAADLVGTGLVPGGAVPQVVEKWATRHLKWRVEVDKSETEATQNWSRTVE